ncbi:hypothetical protein GCM10028895_49370 [Pontibacter rugosus]
MKIKEYAAMVTVLVCVLSLFGGEAAAQADTVVYRLAINQQQVKIADRSSTGMTINGTIPGPTLRFSEGDYAVMHVTNEMDVETSVHWHGLLLPNFYDGVPYLTTPPIPPGETFTYEFPLKHAGTYWYHSHTGLQEQSGVYGSIVIEAKEERMAYDTDLVIVLSDWTYEKPENVLRNLKRGLEIYDIQKGTSTPLSMVIARGALGAQLSFWRQRMEGADISDIYYPAFLTNGQPVREYPELRPGQRVRLRVINAAASSQFWLTFGGEKPLLIAADGLDVVPVQHSPAFIAVAETYDFLVTIPENGKIELRATAQDGSGHTSAFLGQGPVIPAPGVPRPDKIAMMQQMAAMDMRMGAPATKFNPSEEEPYEMMQEWGMQMDGGMDMDHTRMSGAERQTQTKEATERGHDMPAHQQEQSGQKRDMSKRSKAGAVQKDTTASPTGANHSMHGMPAGKMKEERLDSAAVKGMDHTKMNHTKPGMETGSPAGTREWRCRGCPRTAP